MSEKNELRWGYTTGACATAASKAALVCLLTGVKHTGVAVRLPKGSTVCFKIKRYVVDENQVTASVIKDGGDDPDVTHGLEIVASVQLIDRHTVLFTQGEGVGTVTLPGLEIAVGEPAINPVPRKMITEHIQAVLDEHNCNKGVEVTVSVPGGSEVAERTFNPRLGIVGGISILGTTGVVKPYSSEAFIASIRKSVAVCNGNNCREIVLNSGGRSEKYIKHELADLPDYAFVQYGNWIGEALDIVSRSEIECVTLSIMLGKAAKLAQGFLDTHSSKVVFSPEFLGQIARSVGCSSSECKRVEQLTLARNITQILPFSYDAPFYRELANRCYAACKPIVGGKELIIVLVDNDGNLLRFAF